MALSKFVASTEMRRKVNGGKGDFFDFTGLPDEMIDRVFSFLDVRDRMRARMNKRLNKIVAESKYYLEKVELRQIYFEDNKCVNINNRWYPIDIIKRIAHNIAISNLKILCSDSDELTHKFCNIIKEFRTILVLSIRFYDENTANEIMTDSFLLDLSARCEALAIYQANYDNISPGCLHNVYKSMGDDSESLGHLRLMEIKDQTLHGFLNFLGISFRNGQVISNITSFEVYKDTNDDFPTYYVNIFDGLTQIAFMGLNNEEGIDNYSFLMIDIHENLEKLNRAKEKVDEGWQRVRMNVYPE